MELITGVTVKETLLLGRPLTVTTTGPVVALAGTFTIIWVGLQLVAVPALTPLKVTVLVPCPVPKPDPVIVTEFPVTPELGVIELIFGCTVKETLLLAMPLTVTTTGPVVALTGTFTIIWVGPQLDAVPALTPLKVTVRAPWLAPKLEPEIVTEVPTRFEE
jgi:hypothetical protein